MGLNTDVYKVKCCVGPSLWGSSGRNAISSTYKQIYVSSSVITVFEDPCIISFLSTSHPHCGLTTSYSSTLIRLNFTTIKLSSLSTFIHEHNSFYVYLTFNGIVCYKSHTEHAVEVKFVSTVSQLLSPFVLGNACRMMVVFPSSRLFQYTK
jgi:hypothetical protein